MGRPRRWLFPLTGPAVSWYGCGHSYPLLFRAPGLQFERTSVLPWMKAMPLDGARTQSALGFDFGLGSRYGKRLAATTNARWMDGMDDRLYVCSSATYAYRMRRLSLGSRRGDVAPGTRPRCATPPPSPAATTFKPRQAEGYSTDIQTLTCLSMIPSNGAGARRSACTVGNGIGQPCYAAWLLAAAEKAGRPRALTADQTEAVHTVRVCAPRASQA